MLVSAVAALPRSDYIRSLPTLSQAAGFIGLDTGGMSRAVRALGIEPLRWGRRDKHLAIVEVLQVARVAQRASLEEVAGNILEWTEQNHPEALERTTTEIDEFFAPFLPMSCETLVTLLLLSPDMDVGLSSGHG